MKYKCSAQNAVVDYRNKFRLFMKLDKLTNVSPALLLMQREVYSSLKEYAVLEWQNKLRVLSREREGTDRDTPSHGFVICHSH